MTAARKRLVLSCSLIVAIGGPALICGESSCSAPRRAQPSVAPTTPQSLGIRVFEAPHLSSGPTRIIPAPPERLPAAGAGARDAPDNLEFVELSPEQKQLIRAAEERIIDACRRARGLRSETETEVDEPHEYAFDAFRSSDPDAARAVGYGLAERFADEPDSDEPTVDPEMTILRFPDGSLERRWDPRSCRAIGWREIHGDVQTAIELEGGLEVLLSDIDQQAREADVVAQSVQRWTRCARTHGFPHQRPGDAMQQLEEAYLSGQLDLAELRDQELAAAAIEARCAVEAGTAQAFADAKRSAARELLSERTALARAATAHNAALLAAAQRVTADGQRL
jgi:hypothetical protein